MVVPLWPAEPQEQRLLWIMRRTLAVCHEWELEPTQPMAGATKAQKSSCPTHSDAQSKASEREASQTQGQAAACSTLASAAPAAADAVALHAGMEWTWQTGPPVPAPTSYQAPAVPTPATPSASETTLKALVAHLKKCNDGLPAEVQQLVNEAAITSDKMEAKALHNAVNKLASAKKQLTALRNTRWQMHSAWTTFLQQASINWKSYVKDYQEQDTSLQEQITAAKDQLAAARTHLQQYKDKAVDGEADEEVSDDDTMRDAVGREISEGLTAMMKSLEELHARAETQAEDLQRPGKIAKLDPGGGVTSPPSVKPTPSMVPFG